MEYAYAYACSYKCRVVGQHDQTHHMLTIAPLRCHQLGLHCGFLSD